MPLIRYIYGPDVRQFGALPRMVDEVEARVLTAMRRAVRVTEADLVELPKAKLAEVAEQVGADVRQRDAKGHFAKAITEATEQ